MKKKRRLVVLSGAGISAESGLKTFRDSNGLWEGYRVEEVATPEAWQRDQELVLQFYNERRTAVRNAKPNVAHLGLVELQEHFDVRIITQNIDDLHERAGSKNVLHLHGEIFKSRSTKNSQLVYDMEGDTLNIGDLCELKSQLRPHIVWFGESVPMMDWAIEETLAADIFVVIGTSLAVYPAASLIDYAPDEAQKILIDPKTPNTSRIDEITHIRLNATSGIVKLQEILLQTC